MGRCPGEGIGHPLQCSWASLVAQPVKNLPAVWETWVWSLGWEGPLEKGKVTQSSVLAWRIHGLVVQVVTKSRTRLNEFHTHTPPLSPGIRISNLPDSKDACKRGSHRQRLGKGSSPFLILHRLVCSGDTVHALIIDTVAGCYRRRELCCEKSLRSCLSWAFDIPLSHSLR